MTDGKMHFIKNMVTLKLIDSYSELSAHSLAARELLVRQGVEIKEAEKLVDEWNRKARDIVFKAAETMKF